MLFIGYFVDAYLLLAGAFDMELEQKSGKRKILNELKISMYKQIFLLHCVFRIGTFKDNVCIPYLTAIPDFLGTAFLAICFHTLYLLGETGLRDPH